MEYKEAIEIGKCIETLAKFFDEKFEDVAGRLVFLNDDRRAKINKVIEKVNTWSKMSCDERTAALGYTVETISDGNKSIITIEL